VSVKICELSVEQVNGWLSTGVRPPCSEHRHLDRASAQRIVVSPKENGSVREEWCGKKAILVIRLESAREWRVVKSGAFDVHGLVPLAKRKKIGKGKLRGRFGGKRGA
jgi:hypothetical protein